VTELRFFCAIAEQWGNPTGQLHNLNPNYQNRSRKFEKWVITKGWNHSHSLSWNYGHNHIHFLWNYPQDTSEIFTGRGFSGTEVCNRFCRTSRFDWKPSASLETPSLVIRRQMEQFVPRVVFIYWWTAVKVIQAPGDQRPTQPNLSNVGHYNPTLLSNSNNNLSSVCLSVCLSLYEILH